MHTVANFRGEGPYIFPIHSSYNSFTSPEKDELSALAKDLHQHLGGGQYLKSDFVLSPTRGIFITNIEFIPDLREGTHFHKSCESVGAEMHQVIEHILEQFMN